MEHENAQRLRRGYEAFASGDLEKMDEFIPERAVWHVTGNNPFSGEYKGRAAIYGYFGRIFEVTGGTFTATPVHVVADDEMAVAVQRTTATINSRDIATTDILVDRIENGESVETWVYFENEQLLSDAL